MMKYIYSSAFLATTAMGAQFVMYTPGNDDTSVERMDSIINPGAISAHVHQFFGSNGMSPGMTYDSLQQANCTTVGDASGHGNAEDRSAYWHPSLYMEAKDGSGYIRIPTNGHKLYYKDSGPSSDKKADPFEFPKGFRMIAGDASMRGANANVHAQNITQWVCHSNGPWNQGTAGGFPDHVTDCDAYPGFNGAIHFPHCWNGADFDQANPTAHVSYPDGDIENGPCPSSHPTRLPHIFMENQFDLHKMVGLVKPDSFVLAQGDATGYGWHADFVNGWVEGALPELFKTCPQPFYGNEDIGTCPSFKKFDTKNGDCKLRTTFTEKVDGPSQYLPGCNPISNTNPAPKMAVAPLGQSTNQCGAGGGTTGGGTTGGNSGSAPAGSSAAAASPSSSSTAAVAATPKSSSGANNAASSPSTYKPATTLKTSTLTSAAASGPASAAAEQPVASPSHSSSHSHRHHKKKKTKHVTSTATVTPAPAPSPYGYGAKAAANENKNPNVVIETVWVYVTETKYDKKRSVPTGLAAADVAIEARRVHAMNHIRRRRI